MLWLLIIYGCISFRFVLDGWAWLPASMRTRLFALPIIGDVTIDVGIALLVIPAVAAVLLVHYLNKPRIGGFLTETETELRKVAWPSFLETRGASVVVIACVLIMMAFLAGADYLLSQILARVWALVGGSA